MTKQWNRAFLLAIPVLIALIFSAFTVTPALADDSVPPPADPAVVDPPPVETTGTDAAADDPVPAEEPTVVEESAPVEGPVPTAEPVVVEEPVPTAEPVVVEEPAPAEETVAETVTEVLEQLPEGTEVVVTDATGEVLPLVTAEAAEVLVEGDPMWCPTGVAPGGAGCSTNYASFSELVAYLTLNNKTVAGTIWIRDNYVGNLGLEGASVTIDGSVLGTTASYALTLQGGWTGAGTGINSLSPSTFQVPLNIFNWNANVTLNDILVTAVTGGNALTVNTTKDITLNRVEVRDNTAGGGANLNNSGGTGTGKVTVTSSKFNNNAVGRGLDVSSKGAITLNNVIANGNGASGAFLNNSGAATAMAVTIAGSTFNDNGQADISSTLDDPTTYQMGLQVFSKGAITISNLTANYNGGNTDGDGDDGGVWLENTAGTAGVTLTGANFVSDNEWGLGIFTNGAVALNNMVNNGNAFGSGAYIDNCGWDGASCTSAIVAPVSILGTNEFKLNGRGLHITTNGAITLNNIAATFNQATGEQTGGAYLWNANSSTSAGVTLTGLNTFTNNSMTGLQVYSKGVVTLNNVNASYNGWYDTDGGSPTYDTYFGHGAYIDNTFAASPKTVSILGTNTFNGNANGGLVVFSTGAIKVNNVSANNNGWVDPVDADPGDSIRDAITDGAYLDNCALNNNGTPGDDSDDFCASPLTSTITLTGANTFNGNGWGNGLHASGLGAISVSNLNSHNNGGTGALLDNNWVYKLADVYKLPYTGVTVSGYGRASNNGYIGIAVYSTGIVTTNNLSAENNGNMGVRIYNGPDFANPKAVTLNGINTFNGNGEHGLSLTSYGAVTLNNLNARWNGADGVFISNCGWNGTSCTPPVASAVSILGANLFEGNFLNGLEVHSKGAVSASNLTARNNGHYDAGLDEYFGHGVFIDNSEAATAKNVSISGTNTFNDNRLSGLEVYSKGAISVNKLTANWNGWVDVTNEDYWDDDGDSGTPDVPYTDTVYGYGAKLVNTAGLAPVTLTGFNNFESNWNSGLHVESKGNITVYSLTSAGNGQEGPDLLNNEDPYDGDDANGAYLDNWFTGATGNISIVGFANTEGNIEYGLEVYSKGIVSLTNVTARNNWFKGVHIENDASAAAPKAVTISGTNSFNDNGSLGLVIKSYGAVTLNNVNANWNGGPNNAYIDNCIVGTTGCTAITQSPVTLTGTNSFDSNWGTDGNGLYLVSFGKITISNLSAGNNNGGGAYIDNQWFNEAATPVASAGTLTISGYARFNNNSTKNGLSAWSNGNITIANLDANHNGGFTMNTPYRIEDDQVGGAIIVAVKPGTGVANVVLTGYNNLNQNNGGRGLTVYADGAITISNLSANENWADGGARLDNQSPGTATLPMGVTLTGYNNFWHNFQDGLRVYSYGAVSISNVDASENGTANDWSTPAGPEYGWGLYIDNRNPNSLYTRPVTLTGANGFYNNRNSGLEIWSSGAVTLSNIGAGWNGTYYDDSYSFPGANGTYVGCGDQTINNGDGDFYVGCGVYVDNSAAFTPLGVIFSGSNYFERNAHTGLTVISDGAISLSNVTANGNGVWDDVTDTLSDTVYGDGADLLSNQKGVTLTGVNSFDGNWNDGLYVVALDAITISKLDANNNGDNGAYLVNQHGLKHQNVTISGYGNFNNNGNNGLVIYTNGSVSLINVNANSNDVGGAIIDAVDTTFSPANVTISGTNYFEGNRGGDGLKITAFGVISLNNINASWNSGRGAFLDNIEEYPIGYWTPIPIVRLNLTGVNTFNGNGGNGLEFLTYGNVNMTKVTADRNSGNGVLGNTTNGNITLACGSMNNNGVRGYDLTASGKITLSGVNGYSNSLPNSAVGSPVIVNRACPLP